jgi:hypothetical protein
MSFFLWGGRMFEASKFGRAWRCGCSIFAQYGDETLCLERCATATEARLVFCLLRRKIGKRNAGRQKARAKADLS